MSRTLITAFLCVSPGLAAGQHLGPGDFDYPPIPYDARFSYGPDTSQHADLRLPAGPDPHPVAVIIHGGCWQGWHRYRQIERVAEALTKAGWATGTCRIGKPWIQAEDGPERSKTWPPVPTSCERPPSNIRWT